MYDEAKTIDKLVNMSLVHLHVRADRKKEAVSLVIKVKSFKALLFSLILIKK